MKKFSVLFLSLFFSISAFSQNATVMKIWSKYDVAKSIIDAQKNGDIPDDHYQINLNQNLPAVGPQTISYDMYFSLADNMDDDDFYDQKLKITEKSYNIAGNSFYEEYLFENGKLIFFFYKEKFNNCREIRVYFSQEDVVWLSETNFDEDDCQNIISQVEYSNKNLPADYNESIENAIIEAKIIMKLFNMFKVY